MRVLYFAPHQLWPITSGARLRDYHLARGLAVRCAVTFFEIRQPKEANDPPPRPGEFERVVSAIKDRSYTIPKIIRGVAGPVPLTVLNYYSQHIAAELERVLGEGPFDSVQIEGVHLSEYLPVIARAPGPPAIVSDWHNIESELMRRYAANTPSLLKKVLARRTAALIENSEARIIHRCHAHVVASEREREQLLARFPSARINVVPNGVDVSTFTPTPGPQGRSLLFVGAMDYHANVDAVTWFAREVWPRAAAIHPEREFFIVGRNPVNAVLALASDRVRITGTVDDVRPYYANAFAVVVPLRVGAGTRLKVLEAMAAGVPVVSTRLGAEGIDAEPGRNLLIADTPEEMIAALEALTPEKRTALAAEARRLVEQKYDWRILADRLYRVHEEFAGADRARERPTARNIYSSNSESKRL
jgi:glycosyltransferase involved in cell wall biosynthesis